MGRTGYIETSVTDYQSTLRKMLKYIRCRFYVAAEAWSNAYTKEIARTYINMYLYIRIFNLVTLSFNVGRDNSVGIATLYGLDGPGIESRWGRDFPRPSRPAMGSTQPPVQWAPGLFPEVKAARAWCWPPTLASSAEVEGQVQLYIYSLSGPSCPVLGRPLPLPFYFIEFSSF